MKHNYRSFALLILLIGAGCHSPAANNPQLTGAIHGQVRIFAVNDPVRSDSILIRVDESNVTTYTDVEGEWSFVNVPIGTHVITASKPGFGLRRFYNVQVAPNASLMVPSRSMDNAYGSYLAPTPTGSITVDSIAIESWPQQEQFDGFTAYSTCHDVSGIAEFVDTSATVPPDGVHLLEWNVTGKPANSIWLAEHRVAADLHSIGIKSGTTLYYSTCDLNPCDLQVSAPAYWDPVHAQYRVISPGVKSNVVSFTLP